MKKLFQSLIFIFCAFSYSVTYAIEPDLRSASAQVKFEVDILQKNCTVTFTPWAGDAVDVGRVFKQTGAVGPIIPLKFHFKNCNAGAQAIESIRYSQDLNGTGHNDAKPYISTQINGKPSSIRIYMYNDENASIPFSGKTFGTNGQNITPDGVEVCFVQAKMPDQESLLPKQGEIHFVGQAQFTITYI